MSGHVPIPGNVPVPDPSLLTTEQLRREVFALRELLEARLDKTDSQVRHMEKLHEDGMKALNRRADAEVAERKEQIRQTIDGLKEAAAKAEANAITATAKADASVTKQIDSINALLNTGLANVNDKIAVINGRLDKGEGGSHANASSTTMAIAIGAVLVSLIVGLFTAINGAHIANNTSALPPPTTVNPR